MLGIVVSLLLVVTVVQAGRTLDAATDAAAATTRTENATSLVAFTQRESLATLAAVDAWLLGKVTRRELQIARALLARRLSTVDATGQSAGALVGDEYIETLRRLDDSWADSPPGVLPPELRPEIVARVEPNIVDFTLQSKALSDRYQGIASDFLTTTSETVRQQTQRLVVSLLLTLGSAAALLVWVASSVRRRYREAEVLEHRATHDAMTGLVNRHEVIERMHAAVRMEGRPGSIAVLFIDLNGFKRVNDELGHRFGDDLLVRVAHRLQALGEDDPSVTVARLGGDEFVILCDRVASVADAERLAVQVIETVGQPIRIDGTTAQVGAAVGIALAEPERAAPEQLMRYADVAMYYAKRSDDGAHHVYDEAVDGAVDAVQQRRAVRDHADG